MFMHRHKHHHRLMRRQQLPDGTGDTTRLIDIQDGETATIVAIHGGRMLTKRLADLGLTPGAEIKVIGRMLFSGPVQIEVCCSRLVLGKGLASKIIVKVK